jgi:AcrR family transcriptional regulator
MPRLTQTRKDMLGAMMKEAIYEAALSVLIEFGVEGMTMDRVAAAADMAKGSLYNYFRDKQELLLFVHDRMAAPLIRALDESLYADMPAVEALRSVLRTLLAYTAEHYEAMGLLLRNETARAFGETVEQTLHAAGVRFFSSIFQQGMQQGSFKPMDPVVLAQLFVAATSDFLEGQIAAGRQPRVEQTIDTLLSVFLHGVASAEDNREQGSGSRGRGADAREQGPVFSE